MTIEQILKSPCTSYWLQDALKFALLRDPVDAAHDARLLAELLERRAEEILGKK